MKVSTGCGNKERVIKLGILSTVVAVENCENKKENQQVILAC